jgi:hypothetical protein
MTASSRPARIPPTIASTFGLFVPRRAELRFVGEDGLGVHVGSSEDGVADDVSGMDGVADDVSGVEGTYSK